MRKSLIIISTLLALLFAGSASFAQDARQRTPQTIVQDVLALMPAKSNAAVEADIKSLAEAAPESVTILTSMLKSFDSGANDKVEYAINALSQYASDPANAAVLAKVKKGFQQSIAGCKDEVNKAFLEQVYRVLAYDDAEPVIQPATSPDKATPKVSASQFAKLGTAQKRDAIYWIGEGRDASQLPLVLSALNENGDSGLFCDAAIAASKIGGDSAAEKLVGLLGKNWSADKSDCKDAVLKALMSFNGDITPALTKALGSVNGNNASSLIGLAGKRCVKGAANKVFDWLGSDDKAIATSAAEALKGVVNAGDIDKVAKLLDGAKDYDSNLADAYQAALNFYPESDHTMMVKSQIDRSANPQRFFSALARTGSDEATEVIASNLGGKYGSEALAALTGVDNFKAAEPLLKSAEKDSDLILKYIDLVDKYQKTGLKFDDYDKALALADKSGNSRIRGEVLDKMSGLAETRAFERIAGYLDDKDLSSTAATLLGEQAPRVANITDYGVLSNILGKAKGILAKEAAKGYADAGYAIDSINKLLEESKPYENALTAEEKAQGFELLFDGKDMSKWEGDIEGYAPLNGTINVNSNFGGNLYTKKEFTDFVYRFEFRFLAPGVNNGVGIRTPEGVDAAYDAMCELQILDHDDPIYANLREYQVHGSIYGVVPARRIVHKPLGEWSYEEITVKGDHITVTVNGETIVDANVREACQGHNVAPDGSDRNPYTVDHRNHPGMFNPKGHISFCGHGQGLQFKNVRVLDLSK